MVGLQECRSVRGSQNPGDYIRFASGNTSDGHGSCELWLDTATAYAVTESGQECHFRQEQVTDMHNDPRILYVGIDVPRLKVDVLVIHALGSSYSETARTMVEYTLWHYAECRRGAPIILLSDCNARVGSCGASKAIGQHQHEKQNHAGEQLQRYLEQTDLFLPSTWAEFHNGKGYTWQSSSNIDHCGVTFTGE